MVVIISRATTEKCLPYSMRCSACRSSGRSSLVLRSSGGTADYRGIHRSGEPSGDSRRIQTLKGRANARLLGFSLQHMSTVSAADFGAPYCWPLIESGGYEPDSNPWHLNGWVPQADALRRRRLPALPVLVMQPENRCVQRCRGSLSDAPAKDHDCLAWLTNSPVSAPVPWIGAVPFQG